MGAAGESAGLDGDAALTFIMDSFVSCANHTTRITLIQELGVHVVKLLFHWCQIYDEYDVIRCVRFFNTEISFSHTPLGGGASGRASSVKLKCVEQPTVATPHNKEVVESSF